MTSAIPTRAKARRSSSAILSSTPTVPHFPPCVESPRTTCPADSTAFTYNPEDLKGWLMDDDLWKSLPAAMHKVLTPVQHAGAAVMTSRARLEELEQKRSTEVAEDAPRLQDCTAADVIAAKLHEHQTRSPLGRTRSYSRDVVPYHCAPYPLDSMTSSRTVTSSGRSSGHSSGGASPMARLSPPSTLTSFSTQESLSPFDLGEARLPTISRQGSELGVGRSVLARRDSDLLSNTRSITSRRGSNAVKFEPPRDPASSAYHAELEHLRSVCIVRLRHNMRAVDRQWLETSKYDPLFSTSTQVDEASAANAKQIKEKFEQWWIEKKHTKAELSDYIDLLCDGIKFSLGWSDTPGLDHQDAAI